MTDQDLRHIVAYPQRNPPRRDGTVLRSYPGPIQTGCELFIGQRFQDQSAKKNLRETAVSTNACRPLCRR